VVAVCRGAQALQHDLFVYERLSAGVGLGHGVRFPGRTAHDRSAGCSPVCKLYLLGRPVPLRWRVPHARLGRVGDLDAAGRMWRVLHPMLIFLWLLDKVPAPSSLDEQLRTKRQPMDKAERRKFIQTFLPGIVLFVLAYMLLTAFRDFRENFASDVWKTLGYGNLPGIYTRTETPVSIAVLVIMGSIMVIRNNKTALMVNHLIIIIGMLMIGAGTLLFEQELIDAPLWMILIGMGLYLGYVPFNSIFFDRLIAAFRYVGTVGFIMYVADAFGYLGSISVLVFKESGYTNLSWLEFFISGGYALSVTGTLLITGSMIYFHKKHRRMTAGPHSRQ
jgi:hypothetical protein